MATVASRARLFQDAETGNVYIVCRAKGSVQAEECGRPRGWGVARSGGEGLEGLLGGPGALLAGCLAKSVVRGFLECVLWCGVLWILVGCIGFSFG